MSDNNHTRAHVLVSGKVQGVYFRTKTRDEAHKHGVDGWVKNLEDGRVEAVFEGDDESVDAMVDFCHEGSQAARVDDVSVTYGDPEGLDGFEIQY